MGQLPHLRQVVGKVSSEANSVALSLQENLLRDFQILSVPQTDTGRQVENTKANGRTLVKELGKLTP
jgi:hypothetical protein